ncbi:MAG: hypothetical protein NTV88_00750 [Candidatus Micrarchaeota archaeon]|nr:hypothetical protein [Candidatus Micrarchaeota archaeon]
MTRFIRGQAAMEYLVTYGWALLALFAVIAILISTGAFSSSNFAQKECTFQPGLPCSPFIIYTDGAATTIQFSVANDLGFPIKIKNMVYTTTNIGQPGKTDYSVSDPFGQQIFKQSEPMNFLKTFEGATQPSPRDFRTIIVSIQYYNCKGIDLPEKCNDETAPVYTTSGRISSVVEQGTFSP